MNEDESLGEEYELNILVTTPKSKKSIAEEEGKKVNVEGGYWFRVFHFQPQVSIEDRIYFVDDGMIRGYGIIFDCSMIEDSIECTTTGIKHGKVGDWVLKYNDWHWLPLQISWKGFQGIRYIERIPELEDSLIKVESKEFKEHMKRMVEI